MTTPDPTRAALSRRERIEQLEREIEEWTSLARANERSVYSSRGRDNPDHFRQQARRYWKRVRECRELLEKVRTDG